MKFFRNILIAMLPLCGCSLLDDSELSGLDELGADAQTDDNGRKYVVVPSSGGQTLVTVLANRSTKVVIKDGKEWLSASPSVFDKDTKVAVACRENPSLARSAELIFVSDTRSDTLAVRQRGDVEERFSFPVTNAVIYNSQGGQNETVTEIEADVNVPLDEVVIETLYFAGTGWVKDVELKNDRIIVTTSDNESDEMNTANLVFSWQDGWGMLNRKIVVVRQTGRSNRLGTDISFEDLRAMAVEEPNELPPDLVLTGFVVSDPASGNTGENRVEDERVVDFDDDLTVYVESPDGRYGFKVMLNSPEDNVFRRNTRISLLLNGAKIMKTPDEPVRYVISSVTADNLLSSAASEIPLKEKYINQLTDEDIYTFVTLQDCELPIRKGCLTNVNEGYFSIDRYVGKHPVLVRDINGNSLYMYTNVGCPYRRDGRRLPNGSGAISGIITHEKHRSFTELDKDGMLNPDESLRGWIGRYQIRHQAWEDIALAADVRDGFSEILAEWRYMSEELVNPTTKALKPTYPADSDAEFTHSYKGTNGTFGSTVTPSTDWCYIGPMEGSGKGTYGYGILLDDGTDYLADTDNQNADNKGQAGTDKGLCWCNRYWWNAETGVRRAWIISFSTKDISTDFISLQVSSWGRTSSSAPYGGSPRYWNAEWSVTGNMDKDSDWTKIGEYTVPDQVVYQQTRLHQSVGFKPVDLPLPLDILGRDRVYIRLIPSVNKASDGTLDGEQSENIKINNTRANAIEYIAIRYNK